MLAISAESGTCLRPGQYCARPDPGRVLFQSFLPSTELMSRRHGPQAASCTLAQAQPLLDGSGSASAGCGSLPATIVAALLLLDRLSLRHVYCRLSSCRSQLDCAFKGAPIACKRKWVPWMRIELLLDSPGPHYVRHLMRRIPHLQASSFR